MCLDMKLYYKFRNNLPKNVTDKAIVNAIEETLQKFNDKNIDPSLLIEDNFRVEYDENKDGIVLYQEKLNGLHLLFDIKTGELTDG